MKANETIANKILFTFLITEYRHQIKENCLLNQSFPEKLRIINLYLNDSGRSFMSLSLSHMENHSF